MTIRNAKEADFKEIARIYNQVASEPVTGETMLHWSHSDPPGNVHEYFVLEENETIVAFGSAAQQVKEGELMFRLRTIVDEPKRGNGYGTKLARHVHDFAVDNGAEAVRVAVVDSDTRALAYAKKWGFELRQHLFESQLDLNLWNLGRWQTRLDAANSAGYRIATLAQLGDTREIRQSYFEVALATDLDTPFVEDWGVLDTYEKFESEIFHAPEFDPASVFLTLKGDVVVGCHRTSRTADPDVISTDYCGVSREHRGKSLAFAMKIVGLNHAKSLGAKKVITHNDSANEPMLSVNVKLGFERMPGLQLMYKKVK